MATCVVLLTKGGTRNAQIPATVNAPSAAAAAAIVRRATEPDTIGTWSWKDGGTTTTLHLFGYKTGKAGTENKHELPPPHDTVLLFGDAVLFATRGTAFVKFNGTEFTRWYNNAFGGFDDIGSEDSGTDEEEEEEEEEMEVEEAEVDEDAEEDGMGEAEEEEDAPAAPRAAPRAKAKRNAKKLPAWYNTLPLTQEAYDIPQQASGVTQRDAALRLIAMRCAAFLDAVQQCDLERGIYNHSVQTATRRDVRCVWENPEFQTIYSIALRRTVTNLDATSYVGNTRLIERLRDGEFAPHDVAFMTYSDLYPEKWHDLQERAVKREAKMLSVDKSMATDMFKCSRCGKRECTYYEMQTRSADEPMTQFIRCLNCGKQWRQ
jgi:DNA-directed RNA polymerase subunit M/transcription elongation factor TFIIS